MRMKTVRAVSAAVVAAMLLTFPAGCGRTKPGDDPQELFPEYEDNKTMLIGGWDAPINTLEDYQFAKDMGLTYMFIDDLFARRGTQNQIDVLNYCEQVGLKAIMSIGNSANVEYQKESWNADKTDYSQYPALLAINYWDEPYLENFDRLEQLADEHHEKYGENVDYFVNHFPNSASPAFGGKSYSQFIKDYCERILTKCPEGHRYLSADIYPIDDVNGGSVIRSNWLNCIETIAENGKEYGARTNFFIQLTEHYGHRKMSEEDIRWQFYVYMAFGINGFCYFTYRDSILEGFGDSCVSTTRSCSPHDEYYWAQAVNEEILSFDHVYLSFEWNGTMPILGTKNEDEYNLNFDGLANPLESIDCLSAVTADQDTLIGQFKDENGNDGLIVTNFTDPSEAEKDKVVLDFKDVSRLRVYVGGQPKDYKISNNHFEITLNSGEGVFIIPMK